MTSTFSGGLPPEKVDVTTGQTTGTGPLGFSAVLLPYLDALGESALYNTQMRRVLSMLPAANVTAANIPVYYDMVLSLFALGWTDGRYRFLQDGRVRLSWAVGC